MRCSFRYPAPHVVLVLSAIFAFTIPPAAHAQINPQARALLDQMVSAYKALSSYAGTMEVQVAGLPEAKNLRASVVVQKPGRAVVSTTDGQGLTRAITDGEHLQVVSPGGITISQNTESFDKAQAISIALRRGGAEETYLAALLTGRDLLAPQAKDLKSLSLGETGTVGGVPVDLVVAVLKRSPNSSSEETIVYSIGKKDHLLRRVTVTGIAAGKPFTRTETHTNVRVDPILPQGMFAFTAPATVATNTAAKSPPTTLHPAANPGPLPHVPLPTSSTSAAVPAPMGPPSSGEPLRYDFGQVSLLDTTQVEHSFRLQNTSGTPLKIARLSSTCGCTSTIVGSAGNGSMGSTSYPTLAPGEETTIRVAVNLAPLRPGALRKSITVYAEGKPEPVARYEITGTLLPTITFSPPLVDFGRVNAGETRPVTLTATLDARLTANSALPQLVASHPAVRIQPLPDTKTSPASKTVVRTYTVSLAPDAPLGPLTGSITFAPAVPAAGSPNVSKALSATSVFVVGQVGGAVSAQPQAVAFGAIMSGQKATRQIVLTGTNAAVLKNRRITSNSPWLTIAAAHPDKEQAQPISETIEIALRPDAPAGVLQTQLTVTLENGQRLLLPVSAYITTPGKL